MTTLASLPELRSEIHPDLNDPTIDFDSISAKSKSKVWWLGKCTHSWEATIGNRYHGTGCPVCAGQKVLAGFNDFQTFFPALASEWHPVNNGELKPTQFVKGSNKKVWWLGQACHHEWEAQISNRINGTNCPICAGKIILPGFNDLATKYPDIAKLWHPTRNGEVLATQVAPTAAQIYWWLGECGHEWDTNVSGMTRDGRGGCPICTSQRILAGFNDLATLNPTLAAQWNIKKNAPLLPNAVAGKSGKKVWWIGKDCEHEWEATILSRHQGNGCPVCVGQQVLAGFNDLATTNPELAAEWDFEKNSNDFTPSSITANTHQKAWWKASCSHSWEASIANRSRIGRGCPYCANQQTLIGFNDLATTNPEVITEWHPTKNGDLLPTMVVAGAIQSVWWKGLAKDCGHEWRATIFNKVSGVGCPYCGNLKIIVGFNDLGTTHPHLVKEWNSEKNLDKNITEVTFGSSYKAWWICEKKHEWTTYVNNRTGPHSSGCPECSASMFISKGEREIADFLSKQGVQFKTSERRILPKMEIDIYVPDKKIGIEYNGVYWHSEIHKSQKYHHAKWLAAKNAGIQLIQIWEDEWNNNPTQIKAMLLHKLGITQQEKVFARKTFVTQLKKSDIEAFLEEHHVQGYAAGSYYLGLKEKDNEGLVSVLVLKKEANNTFNIIRYATSKNVVGGFTKLLKYAELTYKPSRFITFSDHCVSNGGLYENNGFVADKELAPDYRYVIRGKRQHKFGYRLKKFKDDPQLKWDDSMTEKELAQLNGIPRIWDAGKTRWVKKYNKR